MIPTSFDESNLTLHPPVGMSVDDCSALSCWKGITKDEKCVIISCWKLTKEEQEEFARTGRIWLWVHGAIMPPVSLGTENPFNEQGTL